MSKCCLISTSYLAGLFDIFILLHIWQNCVCLGDFLPMRTLCDANHLNLIRIWISLAFNPEHICAIFADHALYGPVPQPTKPPTTQTNNNPLNEWKTLLSVNSI